MDSGTLTEQDFALIFTDAHTANGWQDKPVADDLLVKIYDKMKFGPTAANSCPLRIVFVRSPEAKEKLKPCLSPGNVDKTMAAPVTAIFAYDMEFYEHLPFLFPHTDAKSWYVGNEALILETARMGGTLQAAYFMITARGMGLDCGPMAGFNNVKLDAAFFPDGRFKSNFICNLGYGDPAKFRPRGPRFAFEDVCTIA